MFFTCLTIAVSALQAQYVAFAHYTGFCKYLDTVHISQLIQCHELTTVKGDNAVTSFVISLLGEGVLKEYEVTGNTITDTIMGEILKLKPTKIFIEQVMVTVDGRKQLSSPVSIVMTY